MSIAEKSIIIAENVPKVYQAGYEKGKADGGGGENPYQYATSFYNHFRNAVFPDGYELSLNVPNVSDLYSAFNGVKGIKKVVLKGNTNAKALSCNGCVSGSSIEEFDFTEFNMIPTTLQNFCNGAKQLKKLIGVIDMSSCTYAAYAFPDSTVFTEIRFKENTIGVSISFAYCSKLSAESVQSIFDGLATVETAQTLTLHGNVKILQSQVDSANAKGWTVAGGKVVSEEEYYG